jgi:hypothetical protein
MASVTAIMNEVTGDCGDGIKVSVKCKGGLVQRWTELALRRVKKLKFFWGGKIAQSWQRRREMVPGIGSRLGCFGFD